MKTETKPAAKTTAIEVAAADLARDTGCPLEDARVMVRLALYSLTVGAVKMAADAAAAAFVASI